MDPELRRICDTRGDDQHDRRNDRGECGKGDIGSGRLCDDEQDRADNEQHAGGIAVVMRYFVMPRDYFAPVAFAVVGHAPSIRLADPWQASREDSHSPMGTGRKTLSYALY